MLKLAEAPVYLHPSLVVHVPAGLLDERAQQLVLQVRHVQALLQGVLGQHHVVVDARLLQRHGDEQLAALRREQTERQGGTDNTACTVSTTYEP